MREELATNGPLQETEGRREQIDATTGVESEHELGTQAVRFAHTETIPITNPTPQMMRRALGSPYFMDAAGRLDVKPKGDKTVRE